MGFDTVNTPPPAVEHEHEVVLDFPDNRLLIDLCGEFDRNLTHIESHLGVQIVRRGNHLVVMGEAREEAGQVLTALYQRLEAGRMIEPVILTLRSAWVDRRRAPDRVKAIRSRCSSAVMLKS